MRRFLACCEEIEQTVAEVYKYWQQTYRDDEEFSTLWGMLADDELAHVSQIRLARRLPVDGVFVELHIDVKAVERLLTQARKLLVDVQKVTLSKEKALRTAIKMEEAFNRAHVENVGGFANPAMKSMFTSLARDDAQHMATLQNYCDRVFGKASI
jgi:rubrerythrin